MDQFELAVRLGLGPERLERLYAYLRSATEAGDLPAAAIQIARSAGALPVASFGRQYLAQPARAISDETIFLVASLTKPITATAVMILVERGLVALDDPIRLYAPEFSDSGKGRVRIRHLLTHTSGLPDMLGENRSLREAQAPLARFVERICQTPLNFAPGTDISYQSMGVAMLGEVVRAVSGKQLPEFLQSELFEPLGMLSTALGATEQQLPRIAEVNIRESDQDAEWGWNSSYWRHFGAPWGGLLSTVGDVTRFCRMFMAGGELDGARILSAATVAAMTRDHTSRMPNIPESVKLGQAWGLGWRLYSTHGWAYCGDLLSPGAYGHGGATGTVMWVDPKQDLACVLLTTQPSTSSQSILNRCSSMAAACVV